MWALEQRHGVEVHGAWFGLTADNDEADRLRREADRCGVGARFHHRRLDSIDGRLCGDAAFLPYRSTAPRDEVLQVTCSGTFVVAFAAAQVDHPLIRTVPDLDVEEAAASLAEGLGGDRQLRSRTACRRFEAIPDRDPGAWLR